MVQNTRATLAVEPRPLDVVLGLRGAMASIADHLFPVGNCWSEGSVHHSKLQAIERRAQVTSKHPWHTSRWRSPSWAFRTSGKASASSRRLGGPGGGEGDAEATAGGGATPAPVDDNGRGTFTGTEENLRSAKHELQVFNVFRPGCAAGEESGAADAAEAAAPGSDCDA